MFIITLQTHFPVLSSGNGDIEPITSHLPKQYSHDVVYQVITI